MTNFTKANREAITKDLLAYTFKQQAEDLRVALATLANVVYHDVYNETTIERMTGLPAGWLPENDRITARFGGNDYSPLLFNGMPNYGLMYNVLKNVKPITRRSQYNKSGQTVAIVYDDRAGIVIVAQRLRQQHMKFLEDYTSKSNRVTGMLSSWTTVEKAIKEWPEIEPFAQRWIGHAPWARGNSLATTIANINKDLGLPVPEVQP